MQNLNGSTHDKQSSVVPRADAAKKSHNSNRADEAALYPYVEDCITRWGWKPLGRTGRGITIEIAEGISVIPDVVGIRTTKDGRTEILTVEVKAKLTSWVQGLGQAAVYQEFAHYSYLAVPKHTDDLLRTTRLYLRKESVIPIFERLGIGLLVFENEEPSNMVEWVTRVPRSPVLTAERGEIVQKCLQMVK